MTLTPDGAGHLIMTLDAKDFTLGISPLQQGQNSTGGGFATAQAIDPYRFPGMICPGPLPTAFTGTPTGTPYTLAYLDNDVEFGSWLMTSTYLWSLTSGGLVNSAQLFLEFSGLLSHPFNTFGTDQGINVNYPHSILKLTNYNPFAKDGSGNIGGSEMLYFTDTDIGYFINGNTTGNVFADNWGSGIGASSSKVNGIHVPNGYFGTNINPAIHRAVIWGLGVVWTNGTSIGTIDCSTQTSTSTYYTVNPNAFILPSGFQARDIRIESGLIQVLCDNGYGNTSNPSRILIITLDASNLFASPNNTEPNDILEIDDDMALAETNINGFPVILTKGRGLGNTIRKKDYWGWPSVQYLKTSGQMTRDTNPSLIGTSSSQLVVGNNTTRNIDLYGSPFATYSYRGVDNTGTFPDALTSPFLSTGTTGVNALTVAHGQLISASLTSSTIHLESFPLSYYTSYNNANAQFQTNFIALPKKCSIDWIKFTILPLSGNEAFTPQLFTDYGTSPISLIDGDLTSLNLDTDTNAKTYTAIGAFANNLALGGNWANSTTNGSTVIINKIDVGLSITA